MCNHNPIWESRILTARGRGARAVVVRGGECGCRWRPSSWDLVAKHIYGVGFIRRSLDLHKFERKRHGLLGLEDLDTTVSHGGCMMSWSLDMKLGRGTVNLCYACMNLFSM